MTKGLLSFAEGIDIMSLMHQVGLVPSKGEARRLIQQGGVKLNEVKVDDIGRIVILDDFTDDEIMIQKGKKKFLRLTAKSNLA